MPVLCSCSLLLFASVVCSLLCIVCCVIVFVCGLFSLFAVRCLFDCFRCSFSLFVFVSLLVLFVVDVVCCWGLMSFVAVCLVWLFVG